MCISPDSCRSHFRSRPVASWPASAGRCPWHGLPCLCFHYALCCHRRRHSHGLYCTYSAFTQSLFFFHLFLTADTTRVSIGAGSILSTGACALVVYSSGCGSHYLLRQYYTYFPLYFWTEGRLSVDERSWFRFHTSDPDLKVDYSQRRAALGMIL